MLDSSRKVVVVGDGMVGKTALLQAYVLDKFQSDYIPTVFETTAKHVQLADGRQVTLGLWDTGGQEEFDQIRQLAYPGASLILLCYSVDCPTSLDNIMQTWYSEVKAYCPSVPLILVGCKSDRRFSIPTDVFGMNEECIPPGKADAIGKQIGAQIHLECSAFTRSNVETVFQLAARFILDNPAGKARGRNVKRILSFNRFKQTSNGSATGTPSSPPSKKSALSWLSCHSA